MEYRNPPTAGEDMPRKPLDGMRALSLARRGEENFPPPSAFTASDGGSGAAPPGLRSRGCAPWALSGAIPTGVNFRALARKEGQSPYPRRAFGEHITLLVKYNVLYFIGTL